jgi:predicted phosphodiesterase
MAAPPITDNPDFPKWYALFEKRKHLPSKTTARILSAEFGGGIPTWRNRVEAMQALDAITDGKNRNRIRDKQKYFVEEILHRSYPYIQPPTHFHKSADPDKTVVVADPHAPYSDLRVRADVLAKHWNAGHVHLNGDVGDFYSKSRYPKTQGHEDFYFELRGTFEEIEFWATNFKRVTIIKGNHDDRVTKKVASMLNSDELWMADTDMIAECASYFGNVEIVGQRITDHGEEIPIDFVWQFGDVVFTHIERSLKQSSAILDTVKQIVTEWAGYFNLKPFRWVVQGHNHRLSLEDLNTCYGILMPMAARPTGRGLRYIFHPSMKGKPPVVGYAVLIRENGKTSFNLSRPYKIE